MIDLQCRNVISGQCREIHRLEPGTISRTANILHKNPFIHSVKSLTPLTPIQENKSWQVYGYAEKLWGHYAAIS